MFEHKIKNQSGKKSYEFWTLKRRNEKIETIRIDLTRLAGFKDVKGSSFPKLELDPTVRWFFKYLLLPTDNQKQHSRTDS